MSKHSLSAVIFSYPLFQASPGYFYRDILASCCSRDFSYLTGKMRDYSQMEKRADAFWSPGLDVLGAHPLSNFAEVSPSGKQKIWSCSNIEKGIVGIIGQAQLT